MAIAVPNMHPLHVHAPALPCLAKHGGPLILFFSGTWAVLVPVEGGVPPEGVILEPVINDPIGSTIALLVISFCILGLLFMFLLSALLHV